MVTRQKPGAGSVAALLRLIDDRVPLPLLGLAGGALAGGAYTLESAPHMVLPASNDLYLVGLILAALGACAGWLIGVLLRAPLIQSAAEPEERRPAEERSAPTASRPDDPAASGRAAPDTERA